MASIVFTALLSSLMDVRTYTVVTAPLPQSMTINALQKIASEALKVHENQNTLPFGKGGGSSKELLSHCGFITTKSIISIWSGESRMAQIVHRLGTVSEPQ